MKHACKNYLAVLATLLVFFLAGCEEDKIDPSEAFTLQKISGDNQTGFGGEFLAEPLKVKLINPNGPLGANKVVGFTIVTGNGTLNTNRVTIDQNGEAQVTWNLGSTDSTQTIQASVLDGDGQPMPSATVLFTAKFKIIKTVAGGNAAGSGANQFWGPHSVFVDAGGNIYVADKGNNRIQKWGPGATVGITVAGGNGRGNAANQFDEPTDVFVEPGGNLYISDYSNNRIQKWGPGATFGTTVAGGNGGGNAANQLLRPYRVYVDAAGNIFISDSNNDRIQKWALGATAGITVAAGNGVGQSPEKLFFPHDVVLDANKNIFIADYFNNRVQKWVPGATSGITVAGGKYGQGSAANDLDHPSGIAIDANGNLYVADSHNHRIQKWAPGATTGITIAGGNGQGSAMNQLNDPFDIFLDDSGFIYIADRQNNRIQKWSL